MKITIKRKPGRPAPEGVEIPTCYALRHRHLRSGYVIDGCRCPSTIAAQEADVERKRRSRLRAETARTAARRAVIAAREALSPDQRDREISDCPATRHNHENGRWRAYTLDGCRCPSTVKAYEIRRESSREATRRYRERKREESARRNGPMRVAQFHLGRANRRDAEAIALGYRLGRVSKHTRGMAILMMLRANPWLTEGEIATRLTGSGQPVSSRTVARFVAALKLKMARIGNPLIIMQDTVEHRRQAA